jgi:TatD DNase family protein
MLEEKHFDLKSVIKDASDNDVKIINNIGTNLEEFEKTLYIANSFDNVYCSLGIHPEEVNEDKKTSIEDIRKWIKNDKVIGIGESGLDYHYDGFNKNKQIKNFEIHIELSRQENKPLIIHSRDADVDMIEILKSEMKNGEFQFLLHSFTSGKELCRTGIDLGAYISLSGIITFKNAKENRENIKNIPLNRLLIETDSPFLAPEPFRGKVNQPAFVKNIATFLSDFWNIDYKKLQHETTNNFIKLFKIKTY